MSDLSQSGKEFVEGQLAESNPSAIAGRVRGPRIKGMPGQAAATPPVGGGAATQEDIDDAIAVHEADTTSVHGIADTASLETTSGAQTKVDTHVNDTSDAHDASTISYAGGTGMSATDVEAAIDELATEKANKAAVIVPFTHTWAIAGEVKVPSGDTDFLVPMFLFVPSGWTAVVSRCRYVINSGTSVTAKLQKNGSDLTGFTGISVTTTAATTNPTDQSIADTDKLALVVTAVSGTPKNMSFSVEVLHTLS